MMLWETLAVFVACIVAMSWASVRLTEALERIGARLKFSDGLLGMVIALGADAPEISSAVAALLSAHHEVGLGVVLGSNIFNLAGLLGLSAVVAGRVAIGRAGLWLNGGVSLAVSVIVLALVVRAISANVSLLLLLFLLIPYAALTAMQPSRIAGLGLPAPIKRFLGTAIAHAHQHARRRKAVPLGSWADVAWLSVSLAVIIGASFGAVDFAIRLGLHWGIDETVVGMLVLAMLTSVPNVIAAVTLAAQGRGAAVISESLNSNSLNVLAGISVPAVYIGFASPEPSIVYAAIWLLCMKLVTLVAASQRRGLSRTGGAMIIVLYILFASAVILTD